MTKPKKIFIIMIILHSSLILFFIYWGITNPDHKFISLVFVIVGAFALKKYIKKVKSRGEF
jgi:hypothetical protein